MNSEKVKKKIYKKWWFWVIIAIIIFGWIGGGEEDAEITTKPTDITITEDKEIEQPPVEKESKRSDMDINQYLEYMIKEVIGEKTNSDKPVFISVLDGSEGIKDITINGSDNLTNNMTVRGMWMDAIDYFKEISKDEEVMKLKGISLIFQMTLVDQYGNESEDPVLIVTLNTDTMEKINWDNFLTENLPNIADTYYLHPALKK